MKSLKMDHELAQLVLNGSETSTWRVNDDKDLTVNDQVELIDKVDKVNPKSWQIIGVATIDKIVAKRLGELTPEDKAGHEGFTSDKQMYETFKGYYGNFVGPETPVKIIHFSFKKYLKAKPLQPGDHRSELDNLKLYADGGSRGNPGPSASGYVLYDKDDKPVKKDGEYLGLTTNNQAEYRALKIGLEAAKELGAKEVQVYMDSLLVINQMKGLFKVRNRDLWPVHESIKQLCQGFKTVKFTHVPRELNKEADAMVNQTLDAATS